MARDVTPGAAARDRLISDVDRMCSGAGAAPMRELSDPAALLVASGLVGGAVAGVVVTRLRIGASVPSIGGYHRLRVLEVQRHDARSVLGGTPHPMVRLAVRTRLAELDRRVTALKGEFVRGGGVFPTRLREVRAARRRGLYLDQSERALLFDALASTPTLQPAPPVPRTLTELGFVAAARGRRDLGRVPLPDRVQTVVDTLPALPSLTPGRGGLPEMYTATIMEAAGLYDRLTRAYGVGGRAVEEIRLQFDSESELVGLAGDLSRLREAATGSSATTRGGTCEGFSPVTGLGAQIDDVWTEVVERVVAFRELVESVESRAHQVAAEATRLEHIARAHGAPPTGVRPRPTATDLAAERLAGGAGNRVIATESMRRLRGQIDPGT